MMRGKPVGKQGSLWKSRLLLLTLQYQRMIGPLCKQKFLPYEHTCLRESLQQIFYCKILPLCIKAFQVLSSPLHGQSPSLLSLGRHQHFNCTGLEPVGASPQCFPSSLGNRWKPASFVPIIAQLYLPAVLIYCRAQRRRRQIFYCKLLGTGRKQERFQKEKTEESY